MSTKTENERMYDVRVVERNIRKGVLTRKDLERFLKSLPDREDNAERLSDLDASESGGNSVGEADDTGT
ncbi:MAG TPA: hypothetical protein VKN99_03470 [Polyangia bacterium]|nr:hypothetical protein [Polyangia bacterium]